MSPDILRSSRGGQQHLAKLLADEEAFATTLLIVVIDRYGFDAINGPEQWHPKTLRMELEQDFNIELPVINGDKLNAAIDILTSDSFFRRMPVFVQYCNVLSGSHPDFGSFDPASVLEIGWGITEGMLIADPEEEEPFSEEIRGYIGKVVHDEGIKTPPDVLRIGEWNPDYSDMPLSDPAMFGAEFQAQSDESKEIKQWLGARLFALLKQLSELPLINGDASKLKKYIEEAAKNPQKGA